MTLQIIVAETDEAEALTLHATLAAWLDRPSQITVARGESAPAARNAALAQSSGPYCHFASAASPVVGSFLTLACRLLDRDANLAFVTGWGESPVGFTALTRPCTAAMLLGRPAPLEAPAVFRRTAWDRLGGFDERLPAGEDVDLCLRALERGERGAVIDAPWRSAVAWGQPHDATPNARALMDKHRPIIERDAIEILVIKERWLRELAAHAAERTGRRMALTAELRRLEEELER